ncbi:hypothetical protein SAMN02745146_3717 [Hymenobacter daecheongensis DSM 21074]|uniref:Tetratricopeptide repeat-containing protein n=1 Tax=Hymenobacter daecheongensis DSM 21074 TaxID=1121955 RepID=A0A1M6LCX7_9BACT|nr:hypothetical protein [Hymenobacter daecheongensis]SHJ69090.1 hypothetical protein SAMN02745146_3717 [Hymenobacter daecheongensis DSM 21074]
MDDLRTTLLSFSAEDRKELGRFIQRQGKAQKGRLDVRLFDLLLQSREYTTDELLPRLYPDDDEPNATAYYALRKRLLSHITDFLLLRQRHHDPTAASSVRGQLTLAEYLFEAGVHRLAWGALRKAEKVAQAHEQYELLNTVYNLQIAQADSEHAEDLADIIRRRNLNKKCAEEEERAGMAHALIRRRLREARLHGRAGEAFNTIIQDVLREYDLQEAFARRPSLLYRLLAITRSAMLARGDFMSFTPFAIRCYHLMAKRHGFTPAHRYYQLGLLYMIAHGLYRSRRFDESIGYLEQLKTVLYAEPRSYFADFYPKYTFLLAANYAFLRRNKDSIQLLEDLLKGRETALAPRDELTARLGLGFHYFAEGQYQKTNRVLMKIGRSDRWCEQQMGLEWVVMKNMGEMLVQLEMDNHDVALNRVRAIERGLRERVEEGASAYHHVFTYLRLVREIIENPEVVKTPAFRQRVEEMPHALPEQREDLQVLSFFGWLRARIAGRPYYEVLLAMSNEQ